MFDDFIERCLLLDLETGIDHRILKIGAVSGLRRGAGTFLRQGAFDLELALDELDRLAKDADFILGHNLLGHDLQVLRSVSPKLALLDKAVVDTLVLSPLAFPKNPYHHLVKDYKLVRQSLNDPVADARLAARVFRDQWQSFAALPADQLAFYAFCLAGLPGGSGLASLMAGWADRPPMEPSRALSFVATSCAGRVCRVELRRLAEGELFQGGNRAGLAYVVAWLGVSGGDSVLPAWVWHRYPETAALLNALRETPCDDPDCVYCRETHDPRRQLKRLFGFDRFRPEPADDEGRSLQEAIVRRGIGGRPHLAILATGAGKSICYQLPALVRYFRRGQLTIVISPLQALMKDQVDNLNEAVGLDRAVALYGLLTPLERGKVLEQLRLGDAAILYVAPEQLRNRSFRRVIEQREIGCWVFDEAHCLSKWGHDFRPDYLYAGRFIAELAGRQKRAPPPVACFTATAKSDVRQEILEYFADHLEQHLDVFESNVDRDELRFRVEAVNPAQKLPRVHELLVEQTTSSPDGARGSTVVYFASRRAAVEAATYLERRGALAAAFHGGMKAVQKREVLEAFIRDEVRVVCATNAFGMGIDKSDVHLVVHADIPGSLESYLQEAGRAGRDRRDSDCVLLFDEGDIEKQFRLAASSRLDPRDIAQVLRGLRRARRREDDAIVVTSGDLLRDETIDLRGDWQADTKVKTAVAWLERAGFVRRDGNETRVFSGKLQVANLEEARRRLAKLGPKLRLPKAEHKRWLAILAALFDADPDEGLSADELAELPGVGERYPSVNTGEAPGLGVIRTLHGLAEAGFLSSGLQLTAYLETRGPRRSATSYEALCSLERTMLELLAEDEPDADAGEWIDLSSRLLNQRLVDRGHRSTPQILRQLLHSLSEDGKGLAAKQGSLELRYRSRFRYRVRLKRSWRALRELAALRQGVGKVLLDALVARVPAQAAGRVLVAFSTDDLTTAIRNDLVLRSQVHDPLAAAERALLFLHEQKVIHLQNGLAVFRQAMTLRIRPQAKGRRYTKGDFEPLRQHYEERTFQVHVMARYAFLGLERIRGALALVMDYFALGKTSFAETHFAGEEDVLRRATSRDSYREIVDGLGNPAQIAIVAAPSDQNLLVLAGPGSGKTRVVVHRCAYLLRVERVPAASILVLCFNRNAALELRRRLRALVGDDARGVTISTYHSLAMRLTGTSFAAALDDESASGSRREPDFKRLIPDAVRLLTSEEGLLGLTADELRDQILSGYSHILVDEYQDINQEQYDLVSALSGRAEADRDRKLTILAVGDDDQTIYGWSGARVEFIRRFRDDYQAEVRFLVESYRSTAHILAAAGQVIVPNRDRMKRDEAIRVDATRAVDDPGGRWSALEPLTGGKVWHVRVGNAAAQAAALRDRLFHMKLLDPELRFGDCAVLARRHLDLETIRSVLDHSEVPVAWSADRERLPPLHRVRELVTLIEELKDRRREIRRASSLESRLTILQADHGDNPWWKLASEILAEWREESGDAELAVKSALEFVYEALAERARETAFGDGVRLATVHAAKGLEYPIVFMLDGGWSSGRDRAEERRLYYVGMTRARELLHVFERRDENNPFMADLSGGHVVHSEPTIELPPVEVSRRRYGIIGLQDLYLSFVGDRPPTDRVHRHLARLQVGDPLEIRSFGENLRLVDPAGEVVAALSGDGATCWRARLSDIEWVRVVAMVERRAEDNEPAYRGRLRSERWEVPLVEVAYRS